MAKIYIEGKPYQVKDKKNLLEACLSLGFDLPYFCWHPAMGSVGACRQCAVKKFKDENDKTGKIVMACMEPVEDGARISIKDPEAVHFRSTIIEWLMTNHPHDCPICDEGGECHLQDMTVMTGHNYRRFRFNKRTYRNQNLGPFINHEMNRCIQCYRCVRFYRDYAGGRDFDYFASKNHVYFGRHEEGTLENEFSGNLVEVCPTGVFTDKTLKQHYTRKWDLTNAPSICHLCGLGCNIIASERYGGLRRILSRYNGAVNGYFLCDRGRFGYEFVNSEKRIRQVLQRDHRDKNLKTAEKDKVLKELGKLISGTKTIGIGSPRASLESNFTLKKMVGEENYFSGMSEREHQLLKKIITILKEGPARTPSLKEVESADVVLVLGEDVTNTAPMLALGIRQAVRIKPKENIEKLNIPSWQDAAVREAIQDEKGPLFIASPNATKLDEVASKTIRLNPDEIARFGYAIAHEIDSKSPAAKELPEEIGKQAKEIAGILKQARNPLVIAGTSYLNEAIVSAGANVAWALCDDKLTANLTFTVPDNNSLGVAMLGGKSLQEAFTRISSGKVDTLVILENDLYRKANKKTVDKALDKCKNVIALHYLENETSLKADFVIPAGSFAEADGTLVNNEGRAQRFYQVFPPKDDVQEAWRWLKDMMHAAGRKDIQALTNFDDFVSSMVKEMPVFAGIEKVAPPHDFRIAGQKIPRAPYRFSGRTAMTANINVSEPKPPEDPDSALSFTMEGYRGKPPSSIIPFFWSPGWNSAQSINKFQIEVGGHLHDGDPGVRLIEPKNNGKKSYFTEIPETPQPGKNEHLVIPMHHIFGSEELSIFTKGVLERAPRPYLAVHPETAGHLKLKEGKKIKLKLNDQEISLPVQFRTDLPENIVGVPTGLPEMPFLDMPGLGVISGGEK